MANVITIEVPDIGDFQDVEVIEVLVQPGEAIEAEASLITLESDKASMEIPAPQAGTIGELLVKVGDRVSQGSPIATLQPADAPAPAGTDAAPAPSARESAPAKSDNGPAASTRAGAPSSAGTADLQADVVVLGSGPGGYTAAFRAADLGLKTVLVERYAALGGVCLNVGCIPSKALLHVAEVIDETGSMAEHGVSFTPPQIDVDKLRGFKEKVIGQLTGGLAGLARQRKVTVVQGTGTFASPKQLTVESADGKQTIAFRNAIIAAGSQASRIPGLPYDDPRVLDSTSALELQDIPGRMLVIGGGIIGLEMATVYEALGSRITVVELMDGLMPGTDRDLVKVLQKRITARYENIYVKTGVTGVSAQSDGMRVKFKGDKAPAEDVFDRVLVSVGRSPNGKRINAEAAGVKVDERGFIAVDRQQRTNVEHIFAIGDIVGQPMLAHKATHEGKVAAEVCAGHKSSFDARTIPSVAYTNPEVAWMGLTETEAKAQGVKYEKGVFPWAASGRALSMGRSDGLTKLLFDPDSKRLLGAGIVGLHAGELIAETVVAIEMGADAEDIGLSIHPHPTLSETVNFAAEVAEGTVTDLYAPKR